MSLNITAQQNNPRRLTLMELGVWVYIINHLRPDGTFCESDQSIANNFLDAHRLQILRTRNKLVERGLLRVIKESHRGSDGWLTPVILFPVIRTWETLTKYINEGVNKDIELGSTETQLVDSLRESPSSRSTQVNKDVEPSSPVNLVHMNNLLYNHIPDVSIGLVNSNDVDIETSDISPALHVGMNKAPAQLTGPYLPGQREIPAAEFNPALIPICPECHLANCDYFEYRGTVDIERFCDDECYAAWSEQQDIRESKGATAPEERI